MLITNPQRIRIYREARKISLREMGRALGCSHTQVAKYEQGKTPNIREEWARQIATMIGLPVSSLFQPEDVFVLPEPSTESESDQQVAS